MLAPWLGGASAPETTVSAAFSSLLGFWMGGAASGGAPVPAGIQYLGGMPNGRRKKAKYPGRLQTPEEVRLERIQLGIIEPDGKPVPDLVLAPKIKKLIRQVAKSQTAPENDNQQAIKRLQQEMDRQQLTFRKEMGELVIRQRDEMRSRDAAYAKALKRLREDDEAIAHLLLL